MNSCSLISLKLDNGSTDLAGPIKKIFFSITKFAGSASSSIKIIKLTACVVCIGVTTRTFLIKTYPELSTFV